MSTAERKLLLIACSNRKIRTKGLLPAIQRYDGVTYRVIRKAMREGYFPPNVDIKILSAKFGLIDANKQISYYDRRMDRERAIGLRPQVLHDLQKIFRGNEHSEVFVNLGKTYILAINGLHDIVGHNVRVESACGGIGSRAKQMKQWLSSTDQAR